MRLALLLPILIACGTNDDDDGVQDATPADMGAMDAGQDAGVKTAEIGTGIDGFQILTEGQNVMLVQGPQGGGRQGGFHVWHAVRTNDLNPDEILLSFTVYKASDRTEIASQERRANLQPATEGDVAYGVAPPFYDCCDAANQDIIMEVVATDAQNKTGTDERRVHAMGCIDVSGTNLCP